MIKTGNQGQKVLGTLIKNEDKEEKPDIKLEESEMRRIEAKNKERNKHKKWPHDARLVHIDGTTCSLECMKNSDYHKEMDEQEFNRINRNKQQEKLTVATPTLNSNAIDNSTSSTNSLYQHAEINETGSADTDRQTQLEQLTVATPTVKEKTSNDGIDTTNTGDQQSERKQLMLNNQLVQNNELTVVPECCESVTDVGTEDPLTADNVETTSNTKTSNADQDVPLDSDYNCTTLNEDNSNKLTDATSVTKTTKRYNIDKSTSTATNQELPDIPDKITEDTLLNIEPITTDCNLLNTVNSSDITLPIDDLPLLEHTEFLDDFEMLMNLENDLDNTHLMSVDDAPTLDVVKEMNKEASVNQDLEIAMDNAHFIDEILLANVAPGSSHTSTTSKKSTPVSPKGTFRTKTHGIRKLTPEEHKNKKFKCEDCEFTAYSRKGVSDHYTERHGSCICEYCDRYFGNPHALKRHQYEHSSDKQYQCKNCYQEFYFQSELKAHRMKHRENPSFMCMANGCGKKFFRNSDLNAHVPVHSGVLHYCDHPGCTYSNLDKRLVTGHKRVHSDKKTFMCKYEGCDETFKHTNARLRHYKRDH